MRKFEAHIPGTLDEALALLASYGAEGRPVAGGTDLFVLMKTGKLVPGHLISIGMLDDLKKAAEKDGVISLGAGLTHSTLAGLDLIGDIPALTHAARSVGSPQVRNAGTLGGNLANASPAADLYPPLLALDARVEILGPGGSRTILLNDFVTGPGATGLAAGEMIGRVLFPRPQPPVFSAHLKVGLRNALAVSVTSAAITARAADGRLREVRIACGAVAPLPIRMHAVERMLEGEIPTKHLVEEAGAEASRACDPITDIRATRSYRCRVTGAIVSRLVQEASRSLLGYGDE
jgi:CO/xanthine dehydrogenase FAD-binding subunit